MASSSSLILPYLSPKTLMLSKSFSLSLSPFPSLKTQKPISFPASYSLSLKPSSSSRTLSSSPFVRRVSVSSQYRQEEDEEVLEDEEEVNFPPELKLFVGNLPFNVDSSELAGLFVQAGNVEKVEVIYDKLTGRSRGFGFVTMSTVEEVKAAEQQFNGYELDGRQLRVNSGPPPRRDDLSSRGFRSGGSSDGRGFRSGGGGGGSYDSANRVHVGNLSWGVDDLALESLFSEQGKVMEAKVVYDRESGRSRGFGFVTYSSAEEVDSAISSLDGVDLKGRQIRVTMAEARPRRQF